MERVHGADPMAVESINAALLARAVRPQFDGLARSAVSVIDIALWDLKAKALTASLLVLAGAVTRTGAVDLGKPNVSYWHVWTSVDGVSHQTRCELTAFEQQSMGGAAPQWNDRLAASGAVVIVAVQPVGWVGEWHENPKPQWIVPLSGRWFVETMDGLRVEMGPGEISLGNDQNPTPDAQGRKGHRSGTIGTEPAVLMIVQLEQEPATGRPCRFK